MATKKRVTQYQYEPPITPRHWSGDELNYAVKLSQTLDDIYNKYSALRTALKEKGEGGGGGIVVETDPTVPAWAKEPNPPKAPVNNLVALCNNWNGADIHDTRAPKVFKVF